MIEEGQDLRTAVAVKRVNMHYAPWEGCEGK